VQIPSIFPAGSPDRDFVRVGRSRIAGQGAFAKRRIPKGTRVIEYTGARVPLATLLAEVTAGTATPIYALRWNETTAIDGARGGNEARFINHSCEPNCEVYVIDDRAYVYAMEDIARGGELTFDYKLRRAARGRRAPGGADGQVCRCGSRHCRGTMRATKRKR
jgi:SET domain-containing protein